LNAQKQATELFVLKTRSLLGISATLQELRSPWSCKTDAAEGQACGEPSSLGGSRRPRPTAAEVCNPQENPISTTTFPVFLGSDWIDTAHQQRVKARRASARHGVLGWMPPGV